MKQLAVLTVVVTGAFVMDADAQTLIVPPTPPPPYIAHAGDGEFRNLGPCVWRSIGPQRQARFTATLTSSQAYGWLAAHLPDGRMIFARCDRQFGAHSSETAVASAEFIVAKITARRIMMQTGADEARLASIWKQASPVLRAQVSDVADRFVELAHGAPPERGPPLPNMDFSSVVQPLGITDARPMRDTQLGRDVGQYYTALTAYEALQRDVARQEDRR